MLPELWFTMEHAVLPTPIQGQLGWHRCPSTLVTPGAALRTRCGVARNGWSPLPAIAEQFLARPHVSYSAAYADAYEESFQVGLSPPVWLFPVWLQIGRIPLVLKRDDAAHIVFELLIGLSAGIFHIDIGEPSSSMPATADDCSAYDDGALPRRAGALARLWCCLFLGFSESHLGAE